jgi:hypothetical protein
VDGVIRASDVPVPVEPNLIVGCTSLLVADDGFGGWRRPSDASRPGL